MSKCRRPAEEKRRGSSEGIRLRQSYGGRVRLRQGFNATGRASKHAILRNEPICNVRIFEWKCHGIKEFSCVDQLLQMGSFFMKCDIAQQHARLTFRAAGS